jgi:hypothetical protein
MLGKCILSAPTAEDLERLINEYYGSENYRIDGNLVFNRKTMEHLDGVYVVCLRRSGRWQMRRREKDEKS